MSLIQVLIGQAKKKLDKSQDKFNYVQGEDIDMVIAEINAAEMCLNRLYELAKIGEVVNL